MWYKCQRQLWGVAELDKQYICSGKLYTYTLGTFLIKCHNIYVWYTQIVSFELPNTLKNNICYYLYLKM